MARVQATARIGRPTDEVFDYLADFSNTAEWDPGVDEARQVGDGPVGLGTRFELVLALGPARVPVTYEIVSYAPDRSVVLETRGRFHRGTDRIELRPAGRDATVLEWDAEFAVKGPGRLLDPLLVVGFRQAARKAMAGLVEVLGGAVVSV